MPIISGGGGGGGSQAVLSASLTLTDAQIKTLVTTPVEIVAAPGAGFVIAPQFAVFAADTTAGAYTNFSALDPTNPYVSSVYLALDALNNFNDATGPAAIDGFLGVAGKRLSWVDAVSGNLLSVGGLLTGSSPAGTAYGTSANNSLGYDNAPLHVVGQNNLGNFTGGDPANTLKVTAFYVIAGLA